MIFVYILAVIGGLCVLFLGFVGLLALLAWRAFRSEDEALAYVEAGLVDDAFRQFNEGRTTVLTDKQVRDAYQRGEW